MRLSFRETRPHVGYNTSVSAVLSDEKTSKILIVDDDEGVTQVFARMLHLEGHQVRTAVSAEKGLLQTLGAEPQFNPLWLEDLVGLAAISSR